MTLKIYELAYELNAKTSRVLMEANSLNGSRYSAASRIDEAAADQIRAVFYEREHLRPIRWQLLLKTRVYKLRRSSACVS